MQFVVDANILFAALIKDGVTFELLLYEDARFFAPEFTLQEFYEHKTEIMKKTRRKPEEFDEIFAYLKEWITIVPKDDYRDMLELAARISPDPDDVPYIALAMKLGIPIWSNDKELEKQKRVAVYSTADFVRGVRL
jgi:predicted nucleic acid-binding protein